MTPSFAIFLAVVFFIMAGLFAWSGAWLIAAVCFVAGLLDVIKIIHDILDTRGEA